MSGVGELKRLFNELARLDDDSGSIRGRRRLDGVGSQLYARQSKLDEVFEQLKRLLNTLLTIDGMSVQVPGYRGDDGVRTDRGTTHGLRRIAGRVRQR